MKIAFFIESLDASRGGRETSTIQVADELARRGHEVSIFCQSAAADLAVPYRVICLPSQAAGKLTRLRDFIAQSRQVVRSRHFDVTQSVLPIPGAGIYQPRGGIVPVQLEGSLRRRGRLLRGPLRAVQLLRRRQQYLLQMERQVMADGKSCVLAVSHLVADDFARHYGRRDGVKVIFNAVSIPDADDDQRRQWRQEIRSQLGLPEDGLLVLTVAANAALKGVGCAIAAFEEFRRSQSELAALLCLGMKARPTQPKAGEPVQLLGHVSDVFRYYSAADVVMLLSWQDACSRVVLEAVRWGVPCITTRYNGASEVLAEGAGVVVSSPDDTAAVVAALVHVANGAARLSMREACLAKADYLSVARHVDELECLYRELALR